MDYQNLVEVLLFASPEPLTQARFNHIIQDENKVDLLPIIESKPEIFDYNIWHKQNGFEEMEIFIGEEDLDHLLKIV